MLQLLIAEPDQRFERGLVAEPMIAAQFKDLGIDKTLDQAEHVGVGAALDLAEIALLFRSEEGQRARQGEAVGEKLVREIEPPATDASKPLGRGSIHRSNSCCGMASNGHRPQHRRRKFEPACERAWKVAEQTWLAAIGSFPPTRPPSTMIVDANSHRPP